MLCGCVAVLLSLWGVVWRAVGCGGVVWRGVARRCVAHALRCDVVWCGVSGRGRIRIGDRLSGFYLQLYRDSNSSPLRFEANAMLLYNAHPVWIRTKG